MSFCEHCQGQRFDRARALRALRQLRRELRAAGGGSKVDAALARAVNAVRDMEIPHLEFEEPPGTQMVH